MQIEVPKVVAMHCGHRMRKAMWRTSNWNISKVFKALHLSMLWSNWFRFGSVFQPLSGSVMLHENATWSITSPLWLPNRFWAQAKGPLSSFTRTVPDPFRLDTVIRCLACLELFVWPGNLVWEETDLSRMARWIYISTWIPNPERTSAQYYAIFWVDPPQ